MRITRLISASAVLVVAYALTGCGSSSGPATKAPAPAAPPTYPAGDSLPGDVTAEMVASGEALFNSGSCAKCHGPGGKNGQYGPNLTDQKWAQISGTFAEIASVITRGIPAAQQKLTTSSPQFAMRARGGMNYTDTQIRTLAAYVWTISHPGHPGARR
jgi:mono/diheme cytochrome c family protein